MKSQRRCFCNFLQINNIICQVEETDGKVVLRNLQPAARAGRSHPRSCEYGIFAAIWVAIRVLQNDKGEKIATATAFYDIYGRDTSGAGWLHWVAVKREYQGRGLSKPLITYVLHIMKGLGYTYAKIPTQTNTWLACKVYLDLGFLPIKENLEHSYEGWKIIKSLTNYHLGDII